MKPMPDGWVRRKGQEGSLRRQLWIHTASGGAIALWAEKEDGEPRTWIGYDKGCRHLTDGLGPLVTRDQAIAAVLLAAKQEPNPRGTPKIHFTGQWSEATTPAPSTDACKPCPDCAGKDAELATLLRLFSGEVQAREEAERQRDEAVKMIAASVKMLAERNMFRWVARVWMVIAGVAVAVAAGLAVAWWVS